MNRTTQRTTAEERAARLAFFASVPRHDPPILNDFERRLIDDVEELRAALRRYTLHADLHARSDYPNRRCSDCFELDAAARDLLTEAQPVQADGEGGKL